MASLLMALRLFLFHSIHFDRLLNKDLIAQLANSFLGNKKYYYKVCKNLPLLKSSYYLSILSRAAEALYYRGKSSRQVRNAWVCIGRCSLLRQGT